MVRLSSAYFSRFYEEIWGAAADANGLAVTLRRDDLTVLARAPMDERARLARHRHDLQPRSF